LRIFAVSDIHVDFEENFQWVNNLSRMDYQNDLLILAGDVTDSLSIFKEILTTLKNRFREVLYIPGNHDLWVQRNRIQENSLGKLRIIKTIAADCGISMEPFHLGPLSIIPLYGWYDFSFGEPQPETITSWADFIACKWPEDYDEKKITQHFIALNEPVLDIANKFIISFSHFLPRIDLMPFYIPSDKQNLYPVLGTSLLEKQIRRLGSRIHIYGHSHVNTQTMKDHTLYINNAFGYPYETMITAKQLKCIHEIN